MKKGIIFDLDQTLVDSSIAEKYRTERKWKELVYPSIPQFILYAGFIDVFNYIRDNDIKVCILSNSPKPYVERVVNLFDIPCNKILGYYEVSFRKPHPDGFNKALSFMNLGKEMVISFGDQYNDIIGSNSARIDSVACLWGIQDKDGLLKSNPTYTINSPLDIIPLLK